MVTFSTALILLILGYFIYGKFVSRFFGADPDRVVPSKSMADGVDYVEMPTWKAFMIQFLNIAGIGPVFGAIMGAQFGASSYLWIVFGTIFGGAVHDYFSGMVSLRHGGASLPNIVGEFLGSRFQKAFTVFSLLLLLLVTCVFVSQPAVLLYRLTCSMTPTAWMLIIFGYYLLATLFPVDKIIGRFYPIFGAALIFMALGVLVALYVNHPALPEIWNGFGTKFETKPIFPMMFVSIACGAVSGFHGTQSPIMSRCVRNERDGRIVFYGAMVLEGLVALIWAAAATAYFNVNGIGEPASDVAMNISIGWLGRFGGIIALFGIIAAPISSGDTALRSARLVIADTFQIPQKKPVKRILVSLPLVVVTLGLLLFNVSKPEGFNIIWRYFSWSNQVLAVFTFWAMSVYLVKLGKSPLMTLIPAVFMSAVTICYFFMADECLRLGSILSYHIGIGLSIVLLVIFLVYMNRNQKLK